MVLEAEEVCLGLRAAVAAAAAVLCEVLAGRGCFPWGARCRGLEAVALVLEAAGVDLAYPGGLASLSEGGCGGVAAAVLALEAAGRRVWRAGG